MIMFLKLSENHQHCKQLECFHKSLYKHMNFAIVCLSHTYTFLSLALKYFCIK